MASVNNIYYTADGPPVMRYQKTVTHSLSGWRIDPQTGKQVDFILESAPLSTGYKYEDLGKQLFNYEHDVVELYSEKEVQFFRKRNKPLFEKGLLQEYDGEPEAPDFANMMSDVEVTKIACLPAAKLTAKLTEITSEITVHRILTTAEEIGRPAKIINQIRERLTTLER